MPDDKFRSDWPLTIYSKKPNQFTARVHCDPRWRRRVANGKHAEHENVTTHPRFYSLCFPTSHSFVMCFFSLQRKPARGCYPHVLFCRKKLYLRRLHWTHLYLGTGINRRITPAKIQGYYKCIQRTFLARDLK